MSRSKEHNAASPRRPRPAPGTPEFASQFFAALHEFEAATTSGDRRRLERALTALERASGGAIHFSPPIRVA